MSIYKTWNITIQVVGNLLCFTINVPCFCFVFFSPGPLAIRRAKSVPSRSRGFWRNSWMTMLHQADTVSETLEGCSLDYIYIYIV